MTDVAVVRVAPSFIGAVRRRTTWCVAAAVSDSW